MSESSSNVSELLEVSELSVHYQGQKRSTRIAALDAVSLTMRRGRTVGLVGESGSGKSTLGRALLGLAPVSVGRIRFDGIDITHANQALRRRLSTRLQVVFQDPYGSLNPAKKIESTLAEPLRVQGVSAQRAKDRIREVLDRVGLPPDTAGRYPAEFSGGQRQRIAIARALVLDPELIICDEAVSSLDLSVQAQILNLLTDLKHELNITYLFISHDLSVVRYMADDIMVLNGGRVVEFGSAESVYHSPREDYTKRLLAAAPKPPGMVRAALPGTS